MRICIVQPVLNSISETFLRAHAERLPGVVGIVHGGPGGRPSIDGKPVLSQAAASRAIRKAHRLATNRSWEWEISSGYLAAFARTRAHVVLAQYGPTGVAVMEACRLAKLPLVVHFHGYDASRHDVLIQNHDGYLEMFAQAVALVVVSESMRRRLIALGAPPHKIHLNHYGVDVERFKCASPDLAPPTFLSAGRLVEKKAPHLTLLAFSRLLRREPQAKLRMIGDGPLRGVCTDLVKALGLADSIEMIGEQPHDAVALAMRRARAFVQHSVEASDGDCEGLPNSILEASASSLPVIATTHAGIPEAVRSGESGILIKERDVDAFADAMCELSVDPKRAQAMGVCGRAIMCESFKVEHSIKRLESILAAARNASHNIARLNPSDAGAM